MIKIFFIVDEIDGWEKQLMLWIDVILIITGG